MLVLVINGNSLSDKRADMCLVSDRCIFCPSVTLCNITSLPLYSVFSVKVSFDKSGEAVECLNILLE